MCFPIFIPTSEQLLLSALQFEPFMKLLIEATDVYFRKGQQNFTILDVQCIRMHLCQLHLEVAHHVHVFLIGNATFIDNFINVSDNIIPHKTQDVCLLFYSLSSLD